MTGFFQGVATAMVTPFTKGGVNFSTLGKLIEFQLSAGVDALVLLGTTGEPSTMTEEEKESVIRFARKEIAAPMKLIVGTGSNCTEKALASAKRAEELGADGVLAVTPYYNRCTQEGVYLYYRAICESTSLPVIAYNIPARTGVKILPETAERLAEIENFAGVKDAGGDMKATLDLLRRVRGKCDVYSGEDLLNLPILLSGGAGVISVVSNILPKTVKEMTVSASRRQLYTANKIADGLFTLTGALFSEVNPIPVKEALNIMGFEMGEPRLPLTPLSAENRAKLYEEMKKRKLV